MALVFSVFVVFSSIPLFKHCMVILLEGVTEEVNSVGIYNSIVSLECVSELHDFHVWMLASGRPSLTAHVRCRGDIDTSDCLK